MDLKEDLIALSLEERMTYDPAENILFINFENFSVKNSDHVREIEAMVEKIVRPLGTKVYAIVNYDNFTIAPDVLNEYTYMVKGLVDRFYTRVTRYTTSTFLRMTLGAALERRDVSPHIYESRTEAQQALGISSKVENS